MKSLNADKYVYIYNINVCKTKFIENLLCPEEFKIGQLSRSL